MEEQREKVISGLADLLRKSKFSVEYCVKKKQKNWDKCISQILTTFGQEGTLRHMLWNLLAWIWQHL